MTKLPLNMIAIAFYEEENEGLVCSLKIKNFYSESILKEESEA